jgi:hypothetical protein
VATYRDIDSSRRRHSYRAGDDLGRTNGPRPLLFAGRAEVVFLEALALEPT